MVVEDCSCFFGIYHPQSIDGLKLKMLMLKHSLQKGNGPRGSRFSQQLQKPALQACILLFFKSRDQLVNIF